jgi:hypothetical protein
MCTLKRLMLVTGATLWALGGTGFAAESGYGGPYGFGSTPSKEEIAAVDIDVMPDGRGLGPGTGTYDAGRELYMQECAACHGEDLQGVSETGGASLIGGRDSLASGQPVKTVESYWPYTTTLVDYVKRAMPFHSPGSLTDDQVYDVVAFVLAEAGIIAKDQKIDAQNLAGIEMPNRDGFIPDPRPDVFNYD